MKLNEITFRKALETAPTHVNTLYNFGVMLDTHCHRKDEAEKLYRDALEGEPRHPFALYNLAVLLEERLAALPPGKKSVRFSGLQQPLAVNIGDSASTSGSVGFGVSVGVSFSTSLGVSKDGGVGVGVGVGGSGSPTSINTPPRNTSNNDLTKIVSNPYEVNINEIGIKSDDKDGPKTLDLEFMGMTDSITYSEIAEDITEEEKLRDFLMREVRTFYERAVDADPTDAATTADFGRYTDNN